MKSVITLVFGIAIGIASATTLNAPAPVQAQEKVRSKVQAPQAFLSGSERSIKVLEKISRQLETLDGRVKKIETVLVKASGEE